MKNLSLILLCLLAFFSCKKVSTSINQSETKQIKTEQKFQIGNGIDSNEKNDLLNEIYNHSGYYYCYATDQLIKIQIDNDLISNEIIEISKDGNSIISVSGRTIPITSINIQRVFEKLKKEYVLNINKDMIFVDENDNIFKYVVDLKVNSDELYRLLKEYKRENLERYLGSYYSDEFKKTYTFEKYDSGYSLEVEDSDKNIIKDYYDFSTKFPLLGKQQKYWITIEKNIKSICIYEYIDVSLYPEYYDGSECDHSVNSVQVQSDKQSIEVPPKQEYVSFSLK